VNNAAGGAPLANFVTNDIKVNAAGNLRAQGMLLTLTAGSIYQDSFGSNVVPSSSFFALAPSLQFDTFVTFGAGGTPGSSGTVQQSTDILTPGGTGADIPGGGAGVTFNNQKLDIVWAPGGGINYPGNDNFMTARISLSKDAQGTFKYFGSTSTDTSSATWGRTPAAGLPIVNGVIAIPEPATLSLFGLAVLGLVGFVRRRA
jgi:PEP-CTERM motif